MVFHARVAFWPWLLLSAVFAIAVVQACVSLPTGSSIGGPNAGEPTFDARSPQPVGDANACRPGNVETYQPSDYHPAAAAGQGVCSPDAIAAFYTDCLDPQRRTQSACDQFTSAESACASCILTPATASYDGPLINQRGLVTPNVAGCIELTDPSNRPCAKAVQARDGCALFACEANCSVHDQTSRTAYDACAGQATSKAGGCSMYQLAAGACTDGELDGGPAAACVAPSFRGFYFAVVPLFCGPPSPWREGGALTFDASEDAAPDASVDVGVDATTDSSRDARADAPSDAPLDAAADALTE
jgi:hypothetical protein